MIGNMSSKLATVCREGNLATKTTAAQECGNCFKLYHARQSALAKWLPDGIAALPDELSAGYAKYVEYENDCKSSQTPPPSP